jgi:hypothetical protein
MSNQFYDEGEPRTKRKVMLATTSYDDPSAAYTFSISRSRQALESAGVQTAYLLLQGNCHVDDARNAVVRDFLASDCDELVFLDADVSWEPESLVQLCSRNVDLVGGVYPYRREHSDNMPVRLKDGAQSTEGMLEVEGLPTGFLKIKRYVLESMAERAPKYWDKLDLTAMVFDRPDPDKDGTRWGGDIAFCNRWRAMGGRIYADAELCLGHTAKTVITDSLASQIRRLSGQTLAHLVPKFRAGNEDEGDYNEVCKYIGNNWAADPGVLALVVGVARKCRGPIIETGSGISSVMMAAVTDQKVYALEHSPVWAAQTIAWAEQAGVSNVGVCTAPLKEFWYDIEQFELPKKYALGFCDGPPRFFGTRGKFFDVIAPMCEVLVVDDYKSDPVYARKVNEWATFHKRTVQPLGRAALITKL